MLVFTFKKDSWLSSMVSAFNTDSVVTLILGLILDLSLADLELSLLSSFSLLLVSLEDLELFLLATEFIILDLLEDLNFPL